MEWIIFCFVAFWAIRKARAKVEQRQARRLARRSVMTYSQSVEDWGEPDEREEPVESEKEAVKRRKRVADRQQAEADAVFIHKQLGDLYGLLDLAESEYHACMNPNRQAKFQKQIMAYERQIHNAESRLRKAEKILSETA